MADKKISQLDAAAAPLAGTEVLPIVQSSATKKVSVAQMQAAPFSAGTGNAVAYLNASKVLTTGSSLTFDGTNVGINVPSPTQKLDINGNIKVTSGSYVGGGLGTANTTAVRFFDASNEIVFYTAASERVKALANGNLSLVSGNLVIGTSGKGIDFSADGQAAGMTSELLDDYEEGTFTPTIVGTTDPGVGTYTQQIGSYTKIGNRVCANITLRWTAHTGTGNIRIAGLPFTPGGTNEAFYIPSFFSFNLALSAGYILVGYLNAAFGSEISVQQTSTGGSPTSAVPMDTAGEIYATVTYRV